VTCVREAQQQARGKTGRVESDRQHTRVKTLPLLAAFLALVAACRNPAPPEEDRADGSVLAPGGPAPIVTGTVLDARTGRPISGALVRGPGGVETRSDERGRFVLRGLAVGASGELVGTTAAGLSGKNLLRALEGGALEVVLHLR
jgi:hypothetical protein